MREFFSRMRVRPQLSLMSAQLRTGCRWPKSGFIVVAFCRCIRPDLLFDWLFRWRNLRWNFCRL